MREEWIATNRRALRFGMVVPALLLVLGIYMLLAVDASIHGWATWVAVSLMAVGGALLAGLVVQSRQPRVAFENGDVLFYLRHGGPIPVPVDLVEAFFLGQGPLALPGASQGEKTVNLVARISQRDPGYAQRDVKPALGAWCESYVTIRGTWCEPLNGELIRRLNHRLREVTEQARAATG